LNTRLITANGRSPGARFRLIRLFLSLPLIPSGRPRTPRLIAAENPWISTPKYALSIYTTSPFRLRSTLLSCTEAVVVSWHVSVGEAVALDEPLVEIETDKATMEFEAVDEGTIGKILISDGSEGVKVNTPIAVLLEEGESADDIDSAKSAPAEAKSDDGEADNAEASDDSDRATPAEGKKQPKPDTSPDWPEGTPMKQQTVREALRDAMAEEMRRDGDVFLMGEEVAEYQGAYKITQGMLDEFGPKRVIDTPITEHGFAGIGVGAALSGEVMPVEGLLKREAGALVRLGADGGMIEISKEDATATIFYPNAERETKGSGSLEASAIAIGRRSVAIMDPKERAKELAVYLKAQPSSEDLALALEDTGLLAPAVIDKIVAVVREQGWDEAHGIAKVTGAKLKGAWEEVTQGERYGSTKAETWFPPDWSEDIAGASQQSLEEAKASAQTSLEKAIAESAVSESEVEGFREQVAELEPAKARVVKLEQTLQLIAYVQCVNLRQTNPALLPPACVSVQPPLEVP